MDEEMQGGMPPEAMPPQAPQDAMPEQEYPAAEQQFETILAGLLEFIVGKGRQGIEKQLKSAKDVPEVIGRITFNLLEEASKQAQRAQMELDMEVMFGVASEVIDSLIRLARAMKIKFPADQEAREESMMSALQAFLVSSKADPEQQQIAQQLLAEMQAEGDTDMAAAEIQRMGKARGVDPFDAEKAAPKKGRGPLMGAMQ